MKKHENRGKKHKNEKTNPNLEQPFILIHKSEYSKKRLIEIHQT